MNKIIMAAGAATVVMANSDVTALINSAESLAISPYPCEWRNITLKGEK